MSKTIEYDIVDLLPHDPPMVLLDHAIEHKDDYIHTSVTIQEDSPFCNVGEVPSYVAIEYMAQAIAAWNGLLSRKQGQKPRIGFLLGSRKLKLHTPCFKVGETLNVFGQSKYNDEEMASFDCWVERDGERIAEASLNVFQPKEGSPLE